MIAPEVSLLRFSASWTLLPIYSVNSYKRESEVIATKKMTNEEFLSRIRTTSPNVELMTEYKTSKDPIECRCTVCSYQWSANPCVLLRGKDRPKKGGGCPRCAGVIRKTTEEFIQELSEIRPNIRIESEYINANTNVKCLCTVCGYRWEAKPHILLKPSDSNCPAEASNAKKDTASFVEELRQVAPHLEVLSEYISAKTPIRCRCTIHDYTWDTTPDSLLHHGYCRICMNEKMRDERIMPKEIFLARMETVSPNIEILGNYTGAFNPIACRCKIDGYEWTAQPTNLLAGYGCSVCSGTKRLSRTEFTKRLKHSNPDFAVIGKYVSRKTKIDVQCLLCGQISSMWPDSLLRGSRCSCQIPAHSSSQEEFLATVLEEVTGQVPLRHDRTLIGSELDILFPDLKLAVEPGDWYFHREKLDHDREKRLACAEKGVRLLTVYYGLAGSFIPEDSNVLTCNSSCVSAEDKIELAKVVLNCLNLNSIYPDPVWDNWLNKASDP